MINITFLGTADQMPSIKRNHTAILLSYESENILVDCGEGTQRQFRKAKINPGKVTRLLITHWHGDHVLGIPGFLQTLSLSGYNKKLYIYGPKHTKEFVRDLLKVFNFQRNFEIAVEEVSGKFFESKDFYLEAKEMQHGIPTNAYTFVKKGQIRINKIKLKKSGLPEGPLIKKLKEGKDIIYNDKKFLAKNLTYMQDSLKVSFVLDTKNNQKIIPFVKDSDLLICESSFDSELKDKAEEHLHLTSAQAAEIAKKSKSKKLILTHISQRYEQNPKKLLTQARKIFKNSYLVNDLDVVKI